MKKLTVISIAALLIILGGLYIVSMIDVLPTQNEATHAVTPS